MTELNDTSATDQALTPMPVRDLQLTQHYDGMIKVAQLMAKAKQSLPKHLHDNPGDCLAIVMMSLQWRLNPWMVGQKTSIINNRLMYEGQLVAAIINNSGMLAKRFRYTYTGEGNARVCTCTGVLKGEEEERSIEAEMPSGNQAKNSPLWGGTQADKDQQLSYKAARIWVRRHAPEVLLGVYTPEDDWHDDKTVIDGQAVAATQQDEFTLKALENKPAEKVDFSKMGAKQKEPVGVDLAAAGTDKTAVTTVEVKDGKAEVIDVQELTPPKMDKPNPKLAIEPKQKPAPVKPANEWDDLASAVDAKKPEPAKTGDLLDAVEQKKPCVKCKGKGSVNFQEQDPETGEVVEGVKPCPACQGGAA